MNPFAAIGIERYHELVTPPPPPCDDYRGSRLAFYFLIFVAVISTARSLVHILAPDGGAGSIAGLVVDVASGANIVAMFGQWGAS